MLELWDAEHNGRGKSKINKACWEYLFDRVASGEEEESTLQVDDLASYLVILTVFRYSHPFCCLPVSAVWDTLVSSLLQFWSYLNCYFFLSWQSCSLNHSTHDINKAIPICCLTSCLFPVLCLFMMSLCNIKRSFWPNTGKHCTFIMCLIHNHIAFVSSPWGKLHNHVACEQNYITYANFGICLLRYLCRNPDFAVS